MREAPPVRGRPTSALKARTPFQNETHHQLSYSDRSPIGPRLVIAPAPGAWGVRGGGSKVIAWHSDRPFRGIRDRRKRSRLSLDERADLLHRLSIAPFATSSQLAGPGGRRLAITAESSSVLTGCPRGGLRRRASMKSQLQRDAADHDHCRIKMAHLSPRSPQVAGAQARCSRAIGMCPLTFGGRVSVIVPRMKVPTRNRRNIQCLAIHTA